MSNPPHPDNGNTFFLDGDLNEEMLLKPTTRAVPLTATTSRTTAVNGEGIPEVKLGQKILIGFQQEYLDNPWRIGDRPPDADIYGARYRGDSVPSPFSRRPPVADTRQRSSKNPPSEEEIPAVDTRNPGFFEVENQDGSHFAAEFTDIQALDPTKTLLILRFSCHPQRRFRFANAVVQWKVSAPPLARGVAARIKAPRILLHAPRQSYGSSTKEQHSTHWSIQLPVQAGAGPIASAGVTPELGRQVDREVSHSMVILGSVRHERTEGVWTLEENESARSGIPSEFQLAMVVEHEGPFVTEIVTSASLKARLAVAISWSKTLESKGRCVRWVNVGVWKGKEQESESLEVQNVKEVMNKMTGEVGGAQVAFAQVIPMP